MVMRNTKCAVPGLTGSEKCLVCLTGRRDEIPMYSVSAAGCLYIPETGSLKMVFVCRGILSVLVRADNNVHFSGAA